MPNMMVNIPSSHMMPNTNRKTMIASMAGFFEEIPASSTISHNANMKQAAIIADGIHGGRHRETIARKFPLLEISCI